MKLSLLLFLLVFACSVIAQEQFRPKNLVNNPSFERSKGAAFSKIEGNLSFKGELAAWKTGNKNTPDLKVFEERKYRRCQESRQYCSKARTGKNMVGIISHMTNNYTDTYREYIVVPLKQRLRPNIKTYVEVWVRKGDYSRIVCNNIGFYFSTTTPMKNIMTNLPLTPQYNHTAVVNQDTQKWEKITGSFMPEQAYFLLTIGNFYDNKETTVEPSIHHDMPAASEVTYAYYLIDDVRVWQEDDTLELIPPEPLVITKSTTLESVEFATSSAVLLAHSKKELQQLVQLLKENPHTHISIHGHTDNVGNPVTNLELSKTRAQAVVNFLIANGIAKNRLEAKGFGAARPLQDNQTATGRAKNRRVEFVVLDE